MISKYLKKKIRLDQNTYVGETDTVMMDLEYYLIESEAEEYDELVEKKTYGFEIVKIIKDLEIERKLIKNFSCSKEKTENILYKLTNNTVTPMELPFILDDLIGI